MLSDVPGDISSLPERGKKEDVARNSAAVLIQRQAGGLWKKAEKNKKV